MANDWFSEEDRQLAELPPPRRAILALHLQDTHRARMSELAKIRAEAMAEAIAGGTTVAELAKVLRVTRSAVYRALSEAGVEVTRPYKRRPIENGGS